jgi:uncharacterized protein (TIGR02996 family)
MNLTPSETDAFVRGILDNPEDRVRRLVFANWLEERGTASSVAWAGYLRMQAECETLAEEDPRVPELLAKADSYRPAICARLELPARAVRTRLLYLRRLLPPWNVQIQFNGEDWSPDWPQGFAQGFIEEWWRDHLLIPVGQEGNVSAWASPVPYSTKFIDWVGSYYLKRSLICFRADTDEVTKAIDRRYGRTLVDSSPPHRFESPRVGLEAEGLRRMFLFAIMFQAGTSVKIDGDTAGYLTHASDPAFEGELIRPEACRHLARHLLSLKVEAESITDGTMTRRVNLPLLSGNPCPLAFQFPVGQRPLRSFRFDFLWFEP